MIDQQVTAQPRQPYGKGAFPGSETLQGPEYPQEDFLRQILCFLVGPHKPVADGVHTPGMDLDQILPGGLFAPQAPLD
jgi:hypothetical protein